ncbi:hypothetical protein [Tardiphaga sp.]|uniref:hypothetical protein n=1 Tax=Tardiphaga sp. TaxID=1926292 RepID=UPI002603026D|nr:hypothetical protein [Tardiphaga sp.]MDB5619607.1 hypothetical protein [Tardiphaga sp.]
MATTFKPTMMGLLVALTAAAAAPTRASAEDPWRGLDLAQPPGEIESVDPSPPPAMDVVPEPDWTLLDTGRAPTASASPREQRTADKAAGSAWTSQKNADGSSALSVKQPLLPFWDTRVGADLNVAGQNAARSASDAYRNKYGDGSQASSGGSAWAAMTAPGVASIWDKTAIEARVDPLADQSKFGTSLSKLVPLAGNQYSLTLQNGYNIIQQGNAPAVGFNGRLTRSYETDQLARLSVTDSGTSFIAGQTLATTDDKWLRKVGAEQKLFGGVNISGTISETLQGPANKSLTAGFKHSW